MFHPVPAFRIAALLGAVACSATAAPAPVYKHRPTKTWFDGWDAPVTKAGGCRFERDGEKLVVTVPGSDHDSALLPRDVEGDFVLEVRVKGAFHTAGAVGHRKAGIVLEFGGVRIRMDRVTETGFGTVSGGFSSEWKGTGQDGGRGDAYCTQDASSVSHFRVRRKGNTLTLEAKEDTREWVTRNSNCPTLTIPKKIKVGVGVDATAPGPFTVEFDQFRLSKSPE